ncbi:GNAT family N-acetyltransferase [soil metagenome]|jgi:phosphinothricin acetyltransferase
MILRNVKIEDAAQIAELYNFYVKNTHHTFETEPLNVSEMQKRIAEISENYPYLVAENDDEILAYAYAAKYKSRLAYQHSVEVSVYVKNNVQQKGIGTELYEKLFDELSQKDIHAIIAGVALPNEASIRLHEKFGFEKIAHFREVGFKFGRWIDVSYWEMIQNQR